MSSGWKDCQVGDVITLQRGFDIVKKQLQPGIYDVIFSSGIGGTHNDFKVKAPGVVIGRKGTLGTVFFTKKDFWPTDTTLWVKDFHGNDEKFAYYFLQTMHLEQLDCGAANPTLNRNHIHTLPVRYPPLPIQRKIAAILSGYDRLIENNTRRIEILEEMARSLYREWFVKFRFPGHEQVQMVDSELGLIPEGWEVGRLDDALILQRGFDLPTQQRKGGNIPIYASTGVTGTHNEAKVKAPGVVTGRSGSLGTVIYIDEDFWPLNTTLWVKEFRRVTPLYAFYLLSDLKLEQYNSGAAVPTLNRNDIHGRPVVIPPQQILEQLNLFVEPLLVLKKNLLKRSDNLRQTRDLLLPRLISGEIDVENLDINTEEIAA
ncbi:restriction endonuclease subunit S [Microcoleus sp. AT9_B5]